ncbi:ribonuclease HII [Paramicrobacterium agarici]|uniref:ribonuclease HII n=1 Tax=Paramicrobacterium agarici TaxID=630514 RepID=UPI00114E03BB|nr:ribonuclease HII [Microbacterium agarici]TQO21407.1 RNase HII [Microbacterium agarici]
MVVCDPTLDLETELIGGGAPFVIGCDEVGRGAIAGPVAVGMAVVDATHVSIPEGLRDSKMLSEKRRTALVPVVESWVRHSAVGLASPSEVDDIGIIAALGLAAKRALALLHEQGLAIASGILLLDGSHDYLTPTLRSPLDVRTRVKGDRDCASIAAASVVAKVHRDTLMIAEHELTPAYGWRSNKGYGSVEHMEAIRLSGPASAHRLTWLKTA